MRIFILGICGTFMAGIATIARQLGHDVVGVDANVYPPMSDYLRDQGIVCHAGYEAIHLQNANAELVIVGNAMSRGNPVLEYCLDQKIPYVSGPTWLATAVLQHRHVLAIAGTHGKTTTTSLLTWILESAGLKPGYLIGGISENLGNSASLGSSPYFVIEADEYDTAFYDKQAKFMHYRPQTLIINNLEYDHADIYPDLAAIQRQFQYLLRTVPANGQVIYPSNTPTITEVLARGCWAQPIEFAIDATTAAWQVQLTSADGSQFEIIHEGQHYPVQWALYGQHNVHNALAAVIAAAQAGVSVETACAALATFKAPKRRMQVRGCVNDITVIDDFAHHPTAIKASLSALRARVGAARIIALLEFGSNTMKMGVYGQAVFDALTGADQVFLLEPERTQTSPWYQPFTTMASFKHFQFCRDSQRLLTQVVDSLQAGDYVLIMSNKGFDGMPLKLLEALNETVE